MAMAETHEMRVDLKWCLWGKSAVPWLDCEPEAFAALRTGIERGRILKTGEVIVIRTEPRKLDCSGTVKLYPRDGRLYADVAFRFPTECGYGAALLADTLLHEIGVSEASGALMDRAIAWVGEHRKVTTPEEDTIDLGEHPKLYPALAAIAAVEDRLRQRDNARWDEMVAAFRHSFAPAT